MRVRKAMAATALSLVLFCPAYAQRPSFSEPALAPDRPEIAFSSGGDIWTVPVTGGEARLLISHPATDSRPLYSPDGKHLAFVSTRTGNGDIYVLDFATGAIRRITFDDGADRLDAWSRDGKYLYFSTSSTDISGMNDILRVAAAGGTPMPVSADRYASEYFSAPSPGGDMLAFTGKGIVVQQWWRHGHSHLDESEIWLRREGSPAKYERVSAQGAKNAWPMWSADGKRLYYMSDRSGAENIWTQPIGGAARQLSNFKNGRLLWPAISYDGKTIAFERDFGIWTLDTASGKSSPVEITLRGAPAGPAVTHAALTNQFRELALSPDGKKVAFVAHGSVFAASSKDGGTAARLTDAGLDTDIHWAPDSRRIVYSSRRGDNAHLYLYDVTKNAESQLTGADVEDTNPVWSHDGRKIAFVRGGKELRVIEVDSKKEQMLTRAVFGKPPREMDRGIVWSPDDQWIAFAVTAELGFRNLSIASVTGGPSRVISYLPNSYSNTISWSPDGKFILFDTVQRTERANVARVDLIPRTPKFREDQFRDLFRDESPKTAPPQPKEDTSAAPTPVAAADKLADKDRKKEPVNVVFDGIRRRLSLLPVGVNVGYQAISPDGKQLLMIAEAAGQSNLYLYSLDDLAKEPAVSKQLTSTAGSKRDAQFSPDGKEIFFLEQGRIQAVNIDTRQVRPIAVTAEMDVDFSKEKQDVFREAWTYLNDSFYDPAFHGADWKALRVQFEPQVQGARTQDELRRIISLMIGELNASHSGIGAAPNAASTTTGRLGLRFDRAEYENSGRFRITEVVALSPAALQPEIKPGVYLLAVDGKPLNANMNLDELLDNKIDRRVVLTVAAGPDGSGKKDVAVKPVNLATEKALLYRQWVEANRAYVEKISNGRLGYVHMFDMGSGSLDQLHLDLDVDNRSKDGVVVDVRNNNGGFVNAYALDILSRKPYLNMTVREYPTAPARSLLGQRSLERPTILVTNQHSLSDAEDFTEGYRALRLGKVVGEPTAGWIIYTGGVSLIDGSVLRLPTVKITTADGTNMERNPRPIDIAVDRPVGESYSGHDSQLDAAVKELLHEIGAPRHQTASVSAGTQ